MLVCVIVSLGGSGSNILGTGRADRQICAQRGYIEYTVGSVFSKSMSRCPKPLNRPFLGLVGSHSLVMSLAQNWMGATTLGKPHPLRNLRFTRVHHAHAAERREITLLPPALRGFGAGPARFTKHRVNVACFLKLSRHCSLCLEIWQQFRGGFWRFIELLC